MRGRDGGDGRREDSPARPFLILFLDLVRLSVATLTLQRQPATNEGGVITKVIIKNYRQFAAFEATFSHGMNILVGDNDTGKSTLLEAIHIALTSRVNGRQFSQELSPYDFNSLATTTYLSAIKEGKTPSPPEILIEVFLENTAETALLSGTNNSLGEDAAGVRIKVVPNKTLEKEFKEYIQSPATVSAIPSEYYVVEWVAFSGNGITSRSIPVATSFIDTSAIRLHSGTDHHLQAIIGDHLEPNERVELARSYRSTREGFAELDAVKSVNKKLAASKGDISDRSLSLGINISQRFSWEGSLVAHLDNLPIQHVGDGEQNTVKMLLALNRKASDSHVILIEEPENHLSFSSLNRLISKIAEKCVNRQVIITTHSSYVLNKLGINNLMLMTPSTARRFTALSSGTQDYFKKLSGYDTLRLVLAKRVILVEGPSDELIAQRAYIGKHGHLPIQDGIDVISVRGLSFARFLDLAVLIEKRIDVITDNDGEEESVVVEKFSDHTKHAFVRIHVSKPELGHTLEPQIASANTLDVLNKIFGREDTTIAECTRYMLTNKTSAALALFDTTEPFVVPNYINDAVA